MELPTGTIVDGSYRITTPLRLGKDVDVYIGEPIAPGPPVMIHILRTALMEGDPALEVFEKAGLELCRFSHDAFPEVVDYGRFMVRPYLVTENVEGKNLTEMIDDDDVSSEQAMQILNKTKEALQAAHAEGMAHGALGPDQVFVTEDGEIKIPELCARWIGQQIASKGEPADPTADVLALVSLSQVLMRGAKRVTTLKVDESQVLAVAPANITADLADLEIGSRPRELESAEEHHNGEEIETRSLQELRLKEPAPLVINAMPELMDITPEPEIEVPQPNPTMVALPPPPPPPIVVMQQPIAVVVPPPQVTTPKPVNGHAMIAVRLPPPPAATQVAPKPMFPTSVPAAVRLPAPAVAVRLPAPAVAAPKPAPLPAPMPAVARTPVEFDLSDDPFLTPKLQPGYIGFFKRMLPGAQAAGENGASRSFNLLLTCSVALLMLAAVLRF